MDPYHCACQCSYNGNGHKDELLAKTLVVNSTNQSPGQGHSKVRAHVRTLMPGILGSTCSEEKGRGRNDGPISPDCETAKEGAMEVKMGRILSLSGVTSSGVVLTGSLLQQRSCPKLGLYLARVVLGTQIIWKGLKKSVHSPWGHTFRREIVGIGAAYMHAICERLR